MKKKHPPKKSPPVPDILHEKIGSGMTEGTRTTYRGAPAVKELRELLERPTRGFFGDMIDALRAFLADAPAERKALETDSMEWYAAAVLKELERVERHHARAADAAGKLTKRSSRIYKDAAEGLQKMIANASYNAALAAYRAGTMNQVARGKHQWDAVVLAHRRLREGGHRGGSSKEKLRGIELFLDDCLKKRQAVSVAGLWHMTARLTFARPLNVGGYDIYRDGSRLHSDDESIGYEAFRKYSRSAKVRLKKLGT